MSSQPKEYQQGYIPDPKAHKDAQGGGDTRPPGQQHKMPDEQHNTTYYDGTKYVPAGKLNGKVALITGGDSGIGRASAILFALEGADSVVVHLPQEKKDAEDTAKAVSELSKGSRQVHLIGADVKSEQTCIDVVKQTIDKLGRLDILFNNAAQQLENNDILTLKSEQWLDTFAVNVHPLFYLSKAAIPHMKEGSTIINNASINAYIGRPDLLDYTSTKGAVISFTRGLSNQIVGEKKIRVNAIAPGPVVTPLVPATFSEGNLEGTGSTPIGRPGQPIECATCVVFLASNDSSFVTGQTIHCNGGAVVNG